MVVLGAVVALSLLVAGCATEPEEPPADVTMPDVVGKALDAAKAELEELGFSSEDIESYDTVESRSQWDDSNWEVTEQSPSAGGTVSNGSEVRLGVRKYSDSEGDESSPAPSSKFDYEMGSTKCSRDSIGGLHYRGVITNTSSFSTGFLIEVEYTASNDVRLDESSTYVGDLAPGQSAAWETIGISSYDNPFSCRIVDVSPN